MGAHFSSQRLAGAVESGVPSISYAYAAGSNGVTTYLGADATYSQTSLPPFYSAYVGQVTPFLVTSAGQPAVTCSPFSISMPSQSLKCPVSAANLPSGQYTVQFSQYISTFVSSSNGQPVYASSVATGDQAANSLQAIGGDVTFSLVHPFVVGTQTSTAPTVTITPTGTLSTVVTSGISEILPSSTHTVPSSQVTVTVYQTTIVSTQTPLSTLTGESTVVTVTGSCSSINTCPTTPPSTTLLKCNADNCLRALRGKSVAASAFCSQYTTTCGMATPTYASQCSGLTSRVSSACSCLVTATPIAARGLVQIVYQAPDYTYGLQPTVTITNTATAGPISTQTSIVPSSTK